MYTNKIATTDYLIFMEYYRPDNLNDALNWLADNHAGIVAGCTDLLALNQSQFLNKVDHDNLLDITAIEQMRGVSENEHGIRIGAATCWSDIIAAPLPPAFDGLKEAARQVGSVQIQNSGTIGGNLCNASAAADGVPPLMVLDASVELISKRGTRKLPLDKFLLGLRQTALQPDELLNAILVPNTSLSGHSTFSKLGARKYLVISIAMIAVRMEISGSKINDVAISVGSCSAVACRLSKIEALLRGQSDKVLLNEIITEQLVSAALSPIDDIRADAPYRLHAARQIIIQCVEKLLTNEVDTP